MRVKTRVTDIGDKTLYGVANFALRKPGVMGTVTKANGEEYDDMLWVTHDDNPKEAVPYLYDELLILFFEH